MATAKDFKTILCEKPSQAADWARFLGFSPSHKRRNHYLDPSRNIAIIHGIGHLFGLAPPEEYVPELKKSWSLNNIPVFPKNFKVEVKPDTKAVFDVIKTVLAKTSLLLIATDADAEGELIAREIIQQAGYKGDLKRVLYSSTDKKALQKAYESPVDESTTRFMAEEASLRRRVDWLIGMNCTMALTTLLRSSGKLPKGAFPVGRVITAAAMIVYINEMARKNFVEQAYYSVKATCRSKSGSTFVATLQIPDKFLDQKIGRCTSLKYATAFAEGLKGKQLKVSSVERKEKAVKPPLPHDLSSLQGAMDKFSIDADEVLAILQTLYDPPVSGVSYPRTECRYLPEGMLDDVKSTVKHLNDIREVKRLNLDLSKKPSAFNDSKVVVHHGIVPTVQSVSLNRLTDKQTVVYLAIVLRYLAQFMADYQYVSQKVTLSSGDLLLLTGGKKTLLEGWRVAEGMLNKPGTEVETVDETAPQEGEDLEDSQFIDVEDGDLVSVTNVEIVKDKTKKPAQLTTAKLVDEMKKPAKWCTVPELAKMLQEGDGLGTPATQSEIVKRAITKGLIIKKGRYLTISKLFEDNASLFSKMDAGFTALLQRDIKAVSGGISDSEIISKYQNYISRVLKEWQTTFANKR